MTGASVHTRRLHQRRAAARVPRPRPSAGVLHHRNRDRRARGSAADGSARAAAAQPAARGDRTRSGGSTSRSARRRSAGAGVIRPAIRRPARSSAGSAARPTSGPARGNRRRARMCEIHPDGSVVSKSARRTSAPARARSSRWSPPRRWGCRLKRVKAAIGDTNYPFAPGSGGSVTVASVSPTVRVAAENAREALFAKVAPPLGVGRPTLEREERPHPGQGRAREGHDVEGRVQAARRRRRSRADGEWQHRGCRASARAACSSPTSRSTSRPASRA